MSGSETTGRQEGTEADATSGGGEVQLIDLVKRFDEVVAVDHVDMRIHGGEFYCLLGPSGCGKTTTLRLIAGFERPTGGVVMLDGRDMVNTAPHKRHVNTVFQSYALFPHLSVEENVAFGLRFKNASKSEAKRKVNEALALVQLENYNNRKPNQLSGGQQQRVALARALVLNPAVLLLDEPLGALDAKLRKALQIELKALQEHVGITFIYVTHDQEEALTMSDRISVMRNGKVEQVGSPREVYEEPASAYVANFLGVSNLMDASAEAGGRSGESKLRLGEFELEARGGDTAATGPVKVTIRPERVRLEAHGAQGRNRIPGMVERIVYLGASIQLIVNMAHGARVQVLLQNRGEALPYSQGTPVSVVLPPDALRVLTETAQPGPVEEDRPEAVQARRPRSDFERPAPRPQI
jgi:spermidine/putrescine transport system ATP-binding protein